jgi:hypothetical protein
MRQPINHPGCNKHLQYSDYHCAAATTSKGGETYSKLPIYKTTIKLAAMPVRHGAKKGKHLYD